MRFRPAFTTGETFQGHASTVHAQRVKDAGLDDGFIWQAYLLLNNLRQRVIGNILVGVARAGGAKCIEL